MVFETINVPAMNMATYFVLQVSERTIGSVMDSGDGYSHIVPIILCVAPSSVGLALTLLCI